MKILITGAAGFIGFHVAKRLLESKIQVIGFDNLNSYYDVKLKNARLKELKKYSDNYKTKFTFIKNNLENKVALKKTFRENKPEVVINLAAQAGVRYSVSNPDEYIQSNLVGFGHLLECCKDAKISHLIYASSSSVYGGNKNLPFKEINSVDHPVSIYAVTKRTNELMAHCYSNLYGLPCTGLRFFTVYGPWGRPDMALFIFTKSIINRIPIKIFNKGHMIRDFTYIDDVVESIFRLINKPPKPNPSFDNKYPNPSKSWCPNLIFNIGNSSPIKLTQYIDAIEKKVGIKAIKEFVPIQPGDVPKTAADTSLIEEWIKFKPNTPLEKGIDEFIRWYKEFYNY